MGFAQKENILCVNLTRRQIYLYAIQSFNVFYIDSSNKKEKNGDNKKTKKQNKNLNNNTD